MSRSGFTALETRAVVSLTSLYLVRMLGLFMALPVLSLYAPDYAGSTPLLMGVAIGIYGLSQALLQLPLGMLSDRIGRKPIIFGGLALLAVGSVIAATSTSIFGLILGRCVQGAGAIGSTLMALVADLTQERNRTKAMASVGVSIGVSFVIALVLGPLITRWAGLDGMFMATAGFALAGLAIARFAVPTPIADQRAGNARAPSRALLGAVLRDPALVRLDIGVFALHFIVTALFVSVPLVLQNELGIARELHSAVYAGLLVASFVAMVPLMIFAERHKQVRAVFIMTVTLMACSLTALSLRYTGFYPALGALFVFFIAFNYLEACLPSLVSRSCRSDNRGTASGVYSSCQFLGAFLGGTAGGWMLQQHDMAGVFWLCTAVAVAWGAVAIGMNSPRYLRAIRLHFDDAISETMVASLRDLPGVREVLLTTGEREGVLQVDETVFDERSLAALPVRCV